MSYTTESYLIWFGAEIKRFTSRIEDILTKIDECVDESELDTHLYELKLYRI